MNAKTPLRSLILPSLPLLGLLLTPTPASAGFGQIIDMLQEQQPIRSHVDAREDGKTGGERQELTQTEDKVPNFVDSFLQLFVGTDPSNN